MYIFIHNHPIFFPALVILISAGVSLLYREYNRKKLVTALANVIYDTATAPTVKFMTTIPNKPIVTFDRWQNYISNELRMSFHREALDRLDIIKPFTINEEHLSNVTNEKWMAKNYAFYINKKS